MIVGIDTVKSEVNVPARIKLHSLGYMAYEAFYPRFRSTLMQIVDTTLHDLTLLIKYNKLQTTRSFRAVPFEFAAAAGRMFGAAMAH